MTTLRVVLDDIAAPASRNLRRYSEELVKQLIVGAPPHCEVTGIVSHNSSSAEYIEQTFPGLAELSTLRLGHDALVRAWQHGVTSIPATRMSGKGLVHSPSLFAPLARHDRVNDVGTQTVVTIHDLLAWTSPESLSSRQVAWNKAMAKRAYKYADAVVVTCHSVASELNEIMNFGDRVRVISGAATGHLSQPFNAEARALALELPERYILATGTLAPHTGLEALIQAMAHPDAPDIPLLISGPPAWGERDIARTIAEAGLSPERVRHLGVLGDEDLAVALNNATIFAYPSIAEGFSLPVLEAFSLGTPVVHSDTPAVVELSGDAAIAVPRNSPETYPERLAQTLADVADDAELERQLSVRGLDRSRIFTWQAAADKVWQLHADL
ncbi:glycosyltransferase family 1 protein [Salinibacterium sp. UTAS2018]|uniref:glycosyltransferase family 4 protein n=1 Tax=unclassified Salinibacterium TaxID=2632331 RepID=UPI00100943A3|nr:MULTISPECIES: glycosyltransferase family 1 protein [unclassified Salinibacterium]MBH0008730.1 glycosyltransferase family 4 protein [Salinibacterium sp. SWN1162]QAV69997.1 glycosyltransferase family 1 protein [Salinibacterium sp. UTAS2018]